MTVSRMTGHSTLPEALADILAQDMTMGQALAAYAGELERLNPAVAMTYEALVERLRAAETGAQAPAIGDRLPTFTLPDQDGRLRTLADFTAIGPTLVSVNRGHWCPFCRIELDLLAKAYAELRRHGATALSIMPERQAFTKIVGQRGVPFPVLSDIDGAYALELGLCFYIGDDLMRLFKRMGHQMPVFQGNESWFLPIPATFVLDGEGRIVDRMIDPDFRLNRMAVDRILAALTRIAEAVR
ncbi:MAG: AhpC/TSA family protein [Hyphomicrobiales bacterium]|nr:AhpC/TSA family protein [Rhodoblastus sp.]MCC2111654.1 AhpC/TSA family protein [Hyphomicrobiales bacterium]